MAEALRGLLSQIAEMKAMPDADIEYLGSLENQVLGFLRAPIEAQKAQMAMGNAAMSGGMGGGAAGLLGLAPRGMGGQMAAPNVGGMGDELRRLISQPQI